MQTGPRGGKFYISRSGNKVYGSLPTPQKPARRGAAGRKSAARRKAEVGERIAKKKADKLTSRATKQAATVKAKPKATKTAYSQKRDAPVEVNTRGKFARRRAEVGERDVSADAHKAYTILLDKAVEASGMGPVLARHPLGNVSFRQVSDHYGSGGYVSPRDSWPVQGKQQYIIVRPPTFDLTSSHNKVSPGGSSHFEIRGIGTPPVYHNVAYPVRKGSKAERQYDHTKAIVVHEMMHHASYALIHDAISKSNPQVPILAKDPQVERTSGGFMRTRWVKRIWQKPTPREFLAETEAPPKGFNAISGEGHDLIRRWGHHFDNATGKEGAVSVYALTDQHEWFAETMTAYVVNPHAMRLRRPEEAAFCQDVRKYLGMGPVVSSKARQSTGTKAKAKRKAPVKRGVPKGSGSSVGTQSTGTKKKKKRVIKKPKKKKPRSGATLGDLTDSQMARYARLRKIGWRHSKALKKAAPSLWKKENG
jgi:hypothetical protein